MGTDYARASSFLEYQRRVCSAEAKAVGHGRPDAGIADALSYERCSIDRGIGIVAVDGRRDEIVLEHQ